jgi:acetyltransferase-like isoleucine patch superfamily enzyme
MSRENLVLGDGVVLPDDVEVGANVVIHAGTVIGAGCVIQDNVVLGKTPKLASRSTAKKKDLPGLVIAERVTVCSGAVVFAGSSIGARTVIGDQAFVRENVTIGEDCGIGRAVCIENQVDIGSRCSIQSNSYITRLSTLEDDVFIAPCVTTTNDNFMGRTDARHQLLMGATIRRAARIGGGVVILPGLEIGEEAFVAAGALVTKDIPAGKLVAGLPARVWRDVPEEELLENQ